MPCAVKFARDSVRSGRRWYLDIDVVHVHLFALLQSGSCVTSGKAYVR